MRATTVLLMLVLCLAAVLRLYQVSGWPVFMDEDDYTQIALDMTHLTFPKLVSHPLSVGKPPLVFLLQAALTSIDGDALLSGRLLSAVSGVATTALTFALGRRLGGRAVALVTASLYASAPLAVLHERMVLQDGPVTAATLGLVVLGWIAIERGSRSLTALGVLLGVASLLIRTSAVVVIVPLVLLTLVVPRARKRWGIVVVIALVPLFSYLALRFGPAGPALVSTEVEHWHPLQALAVNTSDLGDTVLTYLGLPVLTVSLLGALVLARRDARKLVFLVGSIVAWVTPWVVASDFAPSRYYLPALPYVCALVGLAVGHLSAMLAGRVLPRLTFGVGVLLAIGWASVSWQMAADLPAASLTALDNWQYRSGPPSGFGYREAAEYVRAGVPPGASIAYAVDPLHYYGIAAQHAPLAGVHVLGLVSPTEVLPDTWSPVYVVVDDARGAPVGERTRQVETSNPQFAFDTAATFSLPHSPLGVYVLRGRPV